MKSIQLGHFRAGGGPREFAAYLEKGSKELRDAATMAKTVGMPHASGKVADALVEVQRALLAAGQRGAATHVDQAVRDLRSGQGSRAASYGGNPDEEPIYPHAVDHGYGEPLAGGTDVMRKLQNRLLHEQGREERPESPRLATNSLCEEDDMNTPDYWDSFLDTAYAGNEGLDFAGNYLTTAAVAEEEHGRRVAEVVERRFQPKDSVRGLTEQDRMANALPLPVEAGTRVQFVANTGAVLAYDDPPNPNMGGTVVQVKSASGLITAHSGKVFVRWEDGKVRPIHAEHLRAATGRMRTPTAAVARRVRVASLGDLTGFLRLAGTDDTLVHKATKDLWHVQRDGGGYLLERLFDDNGSPLRV